MTKENVERYQEQHTVETGHKQFTVKQQERLKLN